MRIEVSVAWQGGSLTYRGSGWRPLWLAKAPVIQCEEKCSFTYESVT